MVQCAAARCNNRHSKSSEISFFRFPIDQQTKKAWTHYCKRMDFQPNPNHRLCSAHFSIACYERDPNMIRNLGCPPMKSKLKPDAVPDIPLIQPTTAEQKPSLPNSGANEKQRKAETKASTTTMPVKRNPTRSRRTMGIELFMECTEEALSPSQITAQQVARYQYDQAIAQIRDAHAKARIGKAKIINKVDNVGKVSPQVTQKAAPALKTPSPSGKEPERSSSPDIIFVGETPASKPRQPVQQPQPLTQPPQQQQVYKLVSVSQANQGQLGQWMMKPVANVMPQQQQTLNRPVQQVQQVGQQVSGTMGMGYKRPANFQQDQLAKKKPRRPGEVDEYGKKRPFESDESGKSPDICVNGNWVPLDEYYYGKMEGDPTYEEEKGEFRFKCWYCNKMLYNNVKAMMHIQGHIDSSKQQNIDLSDLTQCKHCYKQFDTPFEMQTHVDKVHMSNTNVLLCRICDRDHESRQALTQHMRQNHNACEMPYTCQLCKFRSSMYSDVVDHFKKKHDSSQHLLCLYCLRAFLVKFVSQGWGTTQTYYGHLLKHQSKAQTKKCGLCRLAFFNSAEVKAHKLKHHGPNQKAVLGTSAHSSKQDQVLIKVPSSSHNQHGVKSLNAPSVSKVLDFGGTTFPGEVHYFNCFECKMSMGTHDHYRKYVECSMCRFATICSIAYANHMMGFHSGQMSSLNLNIPWERRMPKPMYCLCGFSSRYGNKIANHLVFCMKTSCYENRPEPGTECYREDEDEDPRHKPGASLLDALGLVKRRTITPMYQKSAETSPVADSSPKPSPWDPDYVPPELQGSQKWKTVKLKDTVTPSKQSVFLGMSKSKGNCKKTFEMDIKNSEEAGTSHKGDTSDEIEEKLLADNGTDSGDKLENSENQRTESTKNNAEAERKENELLDFDNENDRAESGDENKINEIIDALDEDELLQDENEQVSDKNMTLVKESDTDKVDETNLNESCNENEDLANNSGDVKSTNDNLESSSDSVKSPTNNLDDKEKNVNLEGNEKDNENIDSEKQAAADENSEVAEEFSSEDKLDGTESNEEVDNSKIEDDSEKQLKDESILEKDEIVKESSSESKVDENNVNKNVDKTESEKDISEKVNIEESTSQDIEMKDESSSQNKIDKNESENKEVIHSESENKEVIHRESENKEVVHSELEQKEVICSESENKKVIQSESEQTEESRQETADETKTVENESQEPHSSHKLSETGSENKGDNARTKETKSSPNVEESKTSHHQSDDKRYHGSRSHDHRSDSHRSHDNRRSHDDRRSYDDRRSHDRQYHDDRSYHHQGRYDDRNRHRHQDDRGYDRGYHDNRGYNDQRDNRDHYRDDRRHHNRGHYQGRGGYGSGGYHGYR
ncbi:uncharacterized protein LOC127721543 isoform X2 [Mytilus californianus]|uniref:uncharacterized protein LOC127721543 isoform X2 n=1 Tax=Mytilus californianus TaxID=6549 RepID=UPI002246E3CA|nr:uncharacterized protein LOC127721543 isoform X2 [Mytilus californianus]